MSEESSVPDYESPQEADEQARQKSSADQNLQLILQLVDPAAQPSTVSQYKWRSSGIHQHLRDISDQAYNPRGTPAIAMLTVPR